MATTEPEKAGRLEKDYVMAEGSGDIHIIQHKFQGVCTGQLVAVAVKDRPRRLLGRVSEVHRYGDGWLQIELPGMEPHSLVRHGFNGGDIIDVMVLDCELEEARQWVKDNPVLPDAKRAWYALKGVREEIWKRGLPEDLVDLVEEAMDLLPACTEAEVAYLDGKETKTT